MKIIAHSFDLQLKNTFRIAHESRTVQPTVIIELQDKNGLFGLGEATLTRYYGLSLDDMLAQVDHLRPWLENYAFDNPQDFYDQLEYRIPDNTFLRCALDVAAYDLWAKQQQQPLYKLWGLEIETTPTTNYTIGIAPVEEMVEKMAQTPWPIYKIKLGTADDLKIIQTLRQHTNATFRVDANTAWTTEQTLELAPALKELGVEFIEQPLKVDDWAGYRRLFVESPLPIIADESCQTERDIVRCQHHFHGVNIKLMKCGGFTPARRMIKAAKNLELQVMVGCMTESTVGISAIAQLAPLLDYVDMDGAMLLRTDPATGVFVDESAIVQFPDRPGTGALLK